MLGEDKYNRLDRHKLYQINHSLEDQVLWATSSSSCTGLEIPHNLFTPPQNMFYPIYISLYYFVPSTFFTSLHLFTYPHSLFYMFTDCNYPMMTLNPHHPPFVMLWMDLKNCDTAVQKAKCSQNWKLYKMELSKNSKTQILP